MTTHLTAHTDQKTFSPSNSTHTTSLNFQAHCRAILLQTYYKETEKISARASPALRPVLLQLVDLYIVYWALQRVGDLLRVSVYTYMVYVDGE